MRRVRQPAGQRLDHVRRRDGIFCAREHQRRRRDACEVTAEVEAADRFAACRIALR